MKIETVDKLLAKYCNEQGRFDMQQCMCENPNLREKIVCRELNERDVLIIGYKKCPVCNFCKQSKLDLSSHLLSTNDDLHQQLKEKIRAWVEVDDIPRPEIEEILGCSIKSYLHSMGLWRNMSESRPKSCKGLSCPITGCTTIRENSSSMNTLRHHISLCNDEPHLQYKFENGWQKCPVCPRWVQPGKGLLNHATQRNDIDHQFFLQQAYDDKEQAKILRMEEEYSGIENVDYVACKVPGCRHRGIDLRQHLRFHHKIETQDYVSTYKSKLYIEEIMNRGMRESTWGHHDVARDGHETHSWGELFLDDWLHEHSIQHDPHFRPGFGCCSADQAIYVDGITYYLEFDGMGRDNPDSRWTWKNKLKFYDIQIKNGIIGGYIIIRKNGTRDKDDMRAIIDDVMGGFIQSQDKSEYCQQSRKIPRSVP